MKKISEDDINKIIALRKNEGRSAISISEILNIPAPKIYPIIKNIVLTPEQKSVLRARPLRKNVKKVTIICDTCKKSFEKNLSKVNKLAKHHFCDQECKQKFKASKVIIACDFCGKEYEIWKAWLKYKNHYCSKDCKNKHHSVLYNSGMSAKEVNKIWREKNYEKMIAWREIGKNKKKQIRKEYDELRRLYLGDKLRKQDSERYYKARRWLLKNVLHNAEIRAKKNNIPFDLKVDDIVEPLFCPVFGTPLQHSSKKFDPASPSLDRLFPEKGYVKDNVNIISTRTNVLKNNATFDEIEKIYFWFKKEIEKRSQNVSN